MKLFTKVPEKSIQEYIKEAKEKEGSIFLDVRTPEEYEEGHLENSLNLPLHEHEKDRYSRFQDKTHMCYIYCLSGARSKRSAALMGHMGYTHVTDMGGIMGTDVQLVH